MLTWTASSVCVPRPAHRVERGLCGRRGPVARTSSRAWSASAPLAEQEHDVTRLSGGQRERDVQRGAGIEPRPEAARERLRAKRRRPRERPVAAEERGRSPVAERSGSLACANATRPANSVL